MPNEKDPLGLLTDSNPTQQTTANADPLNLLADDSQKKSPSANGGTSGGGQSVQGGGDTKQNGIDKSDPNFTPFNKLPADPASEAILKKYKDEQDAEDRYQQGGSDYTGAQFKARITANQQKADNLKTLNNELLPAFNEVDKNTTYSPIQQLARLYGTLNQLTAGHREGGPEGADGKPPASSGPVGAGGIASTITQIQKQIEDLRAQKVSPTDSSIPSFTDTNGALVTPKVKYDTYGDMYDATATASQIMRDKMPVAQQMKQELDADTKEIQTIKGYTGENQGYTGSFMKGVKGGLDAMNIGLVGLYGTDWMKKQLLSEKYAMDRIFPAVTPDNAGGEALEMLGGVTPLIAGTALTGGEGLGPLIANGLTMGAQSAGTGLYQGYSDARQQGKGEDEAIHWGNKMMLQQGTSGTLLGALLPGMSGAGEKLLLNGVEKNVFTKFLATNSLMTPAFMGNQFAGNIFANYIGDKKPYDEGVWAAGGSAMVLGGMMEFLHAGLKGAVNLPDYTKNVFEMALARRLPEIDLSVQGAVKQGVVDNATADQIMTGIKDKALALAKMPEGLTPQQQLDVAPLVTENAKLEAQKKTVDESFIPGIEAKQEENNRLIREKIGMPLNADEKLTLEGLRAKAVEKDNEGNLKSPLTGSEQDLKDHLEKRVSERERLDKEASDEAAAKKEEDKSQQPPIPSPKGETDTSSQNTTPAETAPPPALDNEPPAAKAEPEQKDVSVGAHATDGKDRLVSGNTGDHITDEGKAQAEKQATDLKDKGVTKIITSPETADIISKKTGAPVEQNENFNTLNIGDFSGLKSSEFEPVLKWFIDHPDATKYEPEDKTAAHYGKDMGESINTRANKVVEGIKQVKAGDANDNVHIVTHGYTRGLIDAIEKNGGVWDDKAREAFKENTRPDNTQITPITAKNDYTDNSQKASADSPSVTRQKAVNKLVLDSRDYNKMRSNAKDRPAALEKLRQKAEELGLSVKRIGTGVKIVNKNGNTVNLNTSFEGNRAPAENHTPLEQRSEESQGLFNELHGLGAENFPEVVGTDGKRMSAKQLRIAIDDVATGNPTNGAEAVLNKIDETVKNGAIELTNPDSRETQQVSLKEYLDYFRGAEERFTALTQEERQQQADEYDRWFDEQPDSVKQKLIDEYEHEQKSYDERLQSQEELHAEGNGEVSGSAEGQTGTGDEQPNPDEQRQQQQQQLDQAKNTLASATTEYNAAKKDLEEALNSKQGSLLPDQGTQQNIFNDTAKMQERVDAAKKALDAAQEDVAKYQKLVDENLPGQKELFGKDLMADGWKDIKDAFNNPTGLLMISPKMLDGFAKIGTGLIQEGLAHWGNLVDKIKEQLEAQGLFKFGKISRADVDNIADAIRDETEKKVYSKQIDSAAQMFENRTDGQIKEYLKRVTGLTDEDALNRLTQAARDKAPDPATKAKLLADAAAAADKKVDEWIGRTAHENLTADTRQRMGQDAIKETVPRKRLESPAAYAKRWQMVDAAIHLYNEMRNLSPEQIADYKSRIDPKTHAHELALIDAAQNLTDAQKKLADNYADAYKRIGARALDAGVIHDVIDGYNARVWDVRNNQTEVMNKFATSTGHSLQRTLESTLQGWAEGMHLKLEGASTNLNTLEKEISHVIENKRLIEEGSKLKNANGDPLFTTAALPGYSKVENPSFKKWSYAGKLADFSQDEAQSFGRRRDVMVGEDGTVMKKEDIYAPTKTADDLNKILGSSYLNKSPLIQKITEFQNKAKFAMLSASGFHHLNFLRAFYLTHQFAGLGEWNPVTAFKKGLELVENNSPYVERLVKGTMTIGQDAEWNELFDKSKKDSDSVIGRSMDVAGNAINKALAGAPKGIKDNISQMMEDHHRFLFSKLGAGLKTLQGARMLENWDRKNPTATEEQRDAYDKAVGTQLNNTYGGQNLKMLRRDPTMQHVARLLMLAPDWTETNIKKLASNFTTGANGNTARQMTANMLMRGAAATVISNLAMALMTDPDKPEEKGMNSWERFVSRYKTAWDEGRLRSTMADITPMYHKLGGDPTKQAYFTIFGMYTDPMKLVGGVGKEVGEATGLYKPSLAESVDKANRDGNIGEYLSSKTSFMVRAFADAESGKDWQGKEFTDLKELTGQDKVFSKNKGALTKYGDTPNHWIHTNQIPSYVMNEVRGLMPIGLQNIAKMMQGETDGFTTVANSVGAGLMENKLPGFKEQKQQARADLAEKINKGGDYHADLNNAIKNKYLSQKESYKFVSDAKLPQAAQEFKKMNTEQQLKTLKSAPADQVKQLLPYAHKGREWYKLHEEKPELFKDEEGKKVYSRVMQ